MKTRNLALLFLLLSIAGCGSPGYGTVTLTFRDGHRMVVEGDAWSRGPDRTMDILGDRIMYGLVVTRLGHPVLEINAARADSVVEISWSAR